MQNIATKIFIYASVAFGILGIITVLSGGPDKPENELLMKLLMITVFIILPSFALSLASKYLSDKS
jgi:hypothetical protein